MCGIGGEWGGGVNGGVNRVQYWEGGQYQIKSLVPEN